MAQYAAIIAAVATVAAAGVGAYAASESAASQSDAANFNKRVALNQATAADNQAKLDEETHRRQTKALEASQRAALGTTGVTDEGSPLLVMADTAREAERGAQLIRYGGSLATAGYQSQAGLQGAYASSYRRAGQIGAGVSLLSGVASLARGQAYSQYSGLRVPDSPGAV